MCLCDFAQLVLKLDLLLEKENPHDNSQGDEVRSDPDEAVSTATLWRWREGVVSYCCHQMSPETFITCKAHTVAAAVRNAADLQLCSVFGHAGLVPRAGCLLRPCWANVCC